MTPVFVVLCSVCTSVILGGNGDLTEEESRLVFCFLFFSVSFAKKLSILII